MLAFRLEDLRKEEDFGVVDATQFHRDDVGLCE